MNNPFSIKRVDTDKILTSILTDIEVANHGVTTAPITLAVQGGWHFSWAAFCNINMLKIQACASKI